MDTIADLAIYAAKYLTWLAEVQAQAFETVPPSPPADECMAVRGPDALGRVLSELPSWEQHHKAAPPKDVAEAWDRTAQNFAAIELALIAQAEQRTDLTLGWAQKVEIAWALTDASTWLMVRLGESEPALLRSFTQQVTALEDPSE
jgi:hypothetical protein